MRLFFALELDDALREQVARALESLRPLAPRAKWVSAENAHLTLVFLGQVADDREPALVAAARSAAENAAPWALHLEGAGTFGPPRAPSVLWTGVGSGAEPLAALQRVLEQALAPLGFPPDPRGYHPHLTLARPGPSRAGNLAPCLEPLRQLEWPSLAVDQLTLFESRPSPLGVRYLAHHRFPLAG